MGRLMQASQLTERLETRYGFVIDSDTAARLLGFRSAESLAQARKTGRVDLDMFEIPRRRGLFTSAKHLARLLLHTLPRAHLPDIDTDGLGSATDRLPSGLCKEVVP